MKKQKKYCFQQCTSISLQNMLEVRRLCYFFFWITWMCSHLRLCHATRLWSIFGYLALRWCMKWDLCMQSRLHLG